jgi:hypothetical protein
MQDRICGTTEVLRVRLGLVFSKVRETYIHSKPCLAKQITLILRRRSCYTALYSLDSFTVGVIPNGNPRAAHYRVSEVDLGRAGQRHKGTSSL